MSEYIIQNGVLYHHGVKCMKWGQLLKRKIENNRSSRIQKYAVKSIVNSAKAAQGAKQGVNNSRYLERSDRYLKKANKLQTKIQDTKLKKTNTKFVKAATKEHSEAGKNYVQRSLGARVATAVTTTAVSIGASYVAVSLGAPMAYVYASGGPKYKLKPNA